jgi:Domain of unknown function (DUF1707)
VNATTRDYLPAEMRASDADRDAVLSALSEHFQAGRLTAEELDERTGQALAARTWGDLRKLTVDLPAATSSSAAPQPSAGRAGPPLIVVLAGVAIAVVVLSAVVHGLIWLLIPALFIARNAIRHSGVSGQED